MTPRITLSKNKSAVDPWFTSWYVGNILYFSWYKDGEEHVVKLIDTKGLKSLQRCFEDAGFAPKYENWFGIGSKDGQYFIEWSEDGEERSGPVTSEAQLICDELFDQLKP